MRQQQYQPLPVPLCPQVGLNCLPCFTSFPSPRTVWLEEFEDNSSPRFRPTPKWFKSFRVFVASVDSLATFSGSQTGPLVPRT
jgi:hypothetical protein